MATEYEEIDMTIHYITDDAILASDDGERENAVWLPKSQIKYVGSIDDTVTIEIPVWLAEENDLI